MSDPLGSVNYNTVTPPVQNPLPKSLEADNPSVNGILKGVLNLAQPPEKPSTTNNPAEASSTNIPEDRTLAARIANERQAGNNAAINQANMNPAAMEVNLRDGVYLEQLRTAASAETETPAKIAALSMYTPVPESWKALEKDLSPKLEEANKHHNAFAHAVRENPAIKVASLAFLPTAPFALWVMTGGETKEDKAVTQISQKQNEFVVSGINDGSIKNFTEKAAASVDFLSGVKLGSLKAEAESGSGSAFLSRFIGAMLEKTMKDASTEEPLLERTIKANDLSSLKERLNGLKAFLESSPKDIRKALETNSTEKAAPVDVIKTLVASASNAPFIEERFIKTKVDPMLEKIGISPEQARSHNEKLSGIGNFFKQFLGTQAKQVDTVMNDAKRKTEAVSRQAAAEVANKLASGLQENQTKIADANKGLLGIVNELVSGASQSTDKGLSSLVGQLNTINQSIQKSSKADQN